ncbi:peptide deformylase [Candidatus Daviesbacteria bacterium]|nr:peptide deformylase [Candidatus Daviesbacteria bacterium]
MRKNFLKPNDPRLIQISQEIPKDQINSKGTKKIIDAMLNIAYGEQKKKDKPIMVGLAAPQIGILKRIILVDTAADGKGQVGELKVFINPKITWRSKRKREWYEGCYSTGKVCGIVSRPISIKIQALTIQGDTLEARYTGYVARIFQHEIDHLDGKVFIDLIKDEDKLHIVEKAEFSLYRDEQAWRHWPNKCSFQEWHKISSIL